MNAFARRHVLAAGLSLIALPGCATVDNYAFEDVVRRLLLASSRRAFARLLQEDGFYADELTRVALPAGLAGNDALVRQVNRAARAAAERAAPILIETIQGLTIIDAPAVMRGGPTAATDLLRREMGEGLFSALLPGVGEALRLAGDDVLGQALAAAPGINFEGLQLDIARKASAAIYGAIGREEAAIRADPRMTDDLILRAVLS